MTCSTCRNKCPAPAACCLPEEENTSGLWAGLAGLLGILVVGGLALLGAWVVLDEAVMWLR